MHIGRQAYGNRNAETVIVEITGFKGVVHCHFPTSISMSWARPKPAFEPVTLESIFQIHFFSRVLYEVDHLSQALKTKG